MSTNSTTVEPDVKPDGGLGNRKDGNLKAAFPGTPTYLPRFDHFFTNPNFVTKNSEKFRMKTAT